MSTVSLLDEIIFFYDLFNFTKVILSLNSTKNIFHTKRSASRCLHYRRLTQLCLYLSQQAPTRSYVFKALFALFASPTSHLILYLVNQSQQLNFDCGHAINVCFVPEASPSSNELNNAELYFTFSNCITTTTTNLFLKRICSAKNW